jgi:hypothetical protein
VNSGGFRPRTRKLEREHIEPVGQIVADLLAVPRTVDETAELLESRLITCTVLTEEHRRLPSGGGTDTGEPASQSSTDSRESERARGHHVRV